MFYNMTKVCLILLLSALVAVQCAVDSPPENKSISYPPEPPKPSPTPTTTAAPPKPSPTPTTTAAPPKPSPTPTTTAKPPSPEPPKTTTANPPTPEPPKTTTAKPPAPDTTTSKTTTTPTPTTPKPPTPKPTQPPLPPKPVDPETGIWNVTNTTSNKSCIVVKFALQIQVPYKLNNKTLIQPINVPINATGNGTCGNNTQTITLTWKEHVADNVSQSICLNFAKNDTTHKYSLQQIDVHLTPDHDVFPGLNDNKTINFVHKQSEFTTSLSKSYKCDKKQDLVVNISEPVANVENATIYMSHFQFQAFENSTKADFASAEDCESSSTPDIVPIAVGVSMALLIIIVFAAYLIGKRRRQARGYLSM